LFHEEKVDIEWKIKRIMIGCTYLYFHITFPYTTYGIEITKKKHRRKIQNAMETIINVYSSQVHHRFLNIKNCQLLTWNKISNKSYIQKSLIQSVIDKR